MNYYNENDPFAAAWLRELIKDDIISPGVVDERSIEDITPNDLKHFTQCHFFAGIGIWSLALREAGWPDDKPIWTGSCPCQPFSAAGKGGGFADERHLWPAFFWLIRSCKPVTVIGEQVASKDGLAWLDLIQSDLEGARYSCGAVDTCAASFGAPHIRQRLYWLADANDARSQGRCESQRQRATECTARESGVVGGLEYPNGRVSQNGWSENLGRGRQCGCRGTTGEDICTEIEKPSNSGGVANTVCERTGRGAASEAGSGEPRPECLRELPPATRENGESGGLADAERSGRGEECADPGSVIARDRAQRIATGFGASVGGSHPGPTNGLWRDVDWLFCRDGRWRPVIASSQFVADAGATRDSLAVGGRASGEIITHSPLIEGGFFKNRIPELRGAGNSLCLAQAQSFVEAVMGCINL